MPYGFQSRYLPLIMRKQGFSLTDLGFYKLLLIPWIFKVFIAAFIVDEFKTKRFWLLFSMICLSFGCLLGSICNDFSYIACIIFLLNWASATQGLLLNIYIYIFYFEIILIKNGVQRCFFNLIFQNKTFV